MSTGQSGDLSISPYREVCWAVRVVFNKRSTSALTKMWCPFKAERKVFRAKETAKMSRQLICRRCAGADQEGKGKHFAIWESAVAAQAQICIGACDVF